MPEGLTLGVLSPFMGGWYFGGLLDGIARVAAEDGANVIALQTLDAGSNAVEVCEPRDPGHRMSFEHVAGFIVVVNAVSGPHLSAVQAAGKPVVVVSHEFPELACPVVVPDNGTGIRAAVDHLLGHGHRRIAFVGCLGTADIRERHEAYREALLAHGLVPDPELLFAAPDNQQNGGEQAARAMVAAGLPSTAVIAGTDANAVGVMRALVAAGHELPRDQAVIGFDDGPAAAFTTPALSTVKQPLQTIARTAVGVLLGQLAGNAGGPARHRVPTELVVRESCGCGASRQAPSSGPGDGPAAGRVPDPHRSRYDDGTYLQTALSMQYEVSMDLLRSHEHDPRQLDWLRRTSASAGCLGAWTGDPGRTADDRALQIVGVFSADGHVEAEQLPATRAAAFPPARLLTVAGEQPGRVVFIVPVKVSGDDWGLLAVVDTVQTRVAVGREPISQWAALLAVALDHRAMLDALREQEAQLRLAALYDNLTGLPNRTLFLDRLGQAMSHHGRTSHRPFGVLFMDLDEFKVVNDSLGHSVGDWLLIEVADRIRAGLRDGDTAARFGGDEFLILLDGIADEPAAAQVAERLHAALAEPFKVAGQNVVLTASIGIALGGCQYEHPADLLRDADLAMYFAKSNDKGTHAVFDVAMHAKAVSRLQTETELRQGLEHGEFEVHYQPIAELRTGRTYGFEALVRWRHPTRGLMAPDSFLPVAEQTGLILPLSRWILAESCRQLAAWQADGGSAELSISVNISNRQFWQTALVDDVAEILNRTGLSPRCLALEITEGVIMRDVDRACAVLEDLHRLGCRVHIDDFGTGYSSLEALHRLPIDALKIDRSFVSRLGVNHRSGEFVRTIVLMGRNLGIDLIAEGIETEVHRELLVQFDCPLGQGYLFSRPVPAPSAQRFALRTVQPAAP